MEEGLREEGKEGGRKGGAHWRGAENGGEHHRQRPFPSLCFLLHCRQVLQGQRPRLLPLRFLPLVEVECVAEDTSGVVALRAH